MGETIGEKKQRIYYELLNPLLEVVKKMCAHNGISFFSYVIIDSKPGNIQFRMNAFAEEGNQIEVDHIRALAKIGDGTLQVKFTPNAPTEEAPPDPSKMN